MLKALVLSFNCFNQSTSRFFKVLLFKVLLFKLSNLHSYSAAAVLDDTAAARIAARYSQQPPRSTDAYDTSPYGFDPHFVAGTSLFAPKEIGREPVYYNKSAKVGWRCRLTVFG